ncbi:MAG TPA: hypothetical protein V6D30_16065 [Leptolyngbyaceae cyanobacterium]
MIFEAYKHASVRSHQVPQQGNGRVKRKAQAIASISRAARVVYLIDNSCSVG